MSRPDSLGPNAAPVEAPDAVDAQVVRLPSGRTLDLRRSRWDGVLDPEQLAFCRARGIQLAYDCAQIGWVPAACSEAAPPSADGERAVDLTAFTTPEQEGMRMLRTLSAQLDRIAAELADAATAAAAIDRLRATIAVQIDDCRTRHGVVAASRWHLAAAARFARAAAPPPASDHPSGEFSFRAWTRADAPRYRAMLDNPRLWRYLPESYPQPLTEATALALIELGSVDDRQQALAVVHAGEPIGQCLLRLHEPFAGMRTAEVAYWLAEEHWGKGWMSRVLPAFVGHCFATSEVEVLEAWIREDHAASARVAERGGFRRDWFAFEGELAAALSKPRARRYVVYRGEFASLRAGTSVSSGVATS